MNYEYKDLNSLLNIQSNEKKLEILQAELEGLPYKKYAQQLLEKEEDINSKKHSIVSVNANLKAKIASTKNYTSDLMQKIDDYNCQLKTLQGDYKKAETLLSEIESLGKKVAELENENLELNEKLYKCEEAHLMYDEALNKIEAKKLEVLTSYKQKEAEIESKTNEITRQNEKLKASLSPDLLKFYTLNYKKFAGIVLSTLINNNTCSVCRTMFSDARLIEIHKTAPCSTCPHCHRLMMVGE